MWATPDESSDYITSVYRQACAHSDLTVTELDLDAPGHVAHWPDGHQGTTLGVLLIRMVAETAQHAGHADIIREQIDGHIGGDQATMRLSVLAQQKNHHPRSRQPLPPTARKPVAPSRTRLLASRP